MYLTCHGNMITYKQHLRQRGIPGPVGGTLLDALAVASSSLYFISSLLAYQSVAGTRGMHRCKYYICLYSVPNIVQMIHLNACSSMQIYGAQPCGIALLLYPKHICKEVYTILQERYYAMRDHIRADANSLAKAGSHAADRRLVPGFKPGSRLTVSHKKASSTPATQAAADLGREALSTLQELLDINTCGGLSRLPGQHEEEGSSGRADVGHDDDDEPGHSRQGVKGQRSAGSIAAHNSQLITAAAGVANAGGGGCGYGGGAGRGVMGGGSHLAEAIGVGAAEAQQAAAYLKCECLPCPARVLSSHVMP